MFKVLIWGTLIFIAIGAFGIWLKRLRGDEQP
jgi:hypothetical protein